jgi:hypothetical protein
MLMKSLEESVTWELMSEYQPSECERDYFRRRAVEERAAAEYALDPLAKRAHLELASCYDDIAESIGRSASSERIQFRIGLRAPPEQSA